MDESYRLIFRAEVLDGQHRAVVRRRLIEALKLDEPTADRLFSGRSVVIKRGVDKPTAERYQMLFQRAGAKLSVVAEENTADSPADSTTATPVPANAGAGTGGAPSDLSLVSDYVPLPTEGRQEIIAPDFDVAAVGADLVDAVEEPPVEVPDAEFDLAEPGADLVDRREPPAVTVPDAPFQLAAAGEDLLVERPAPVDVELGPLDFEVAEVGAVIGVAENEEPAPAPDVSHLKLLDS